MYSLDGDYEPNGEYGIIMKNVKAPKGYVFVCLACGKRSRDAWGENPIDRGWDESCFLNRELCKTDELGIEGGKVVSVCGSKIARGII